MENCKSKGQVISEVLILSVFVLSAFLFAVRKMKTAETRLQKQNRIHAEVQGAN